ncbi:MAG: hypothetical protein AB1746_10195 [Candidatus Zixiibacteriota bacterium]
MTDAVDHIWDENNDLLNPDESEDDCPSAGESRPRMKPGEYIAYCYETSLGHYKGEQKLYIRFRLLGGEYDGLELFLPCPYSPGKKKPSTKYYRLWEIVNGAPPQKGQKIAKHIFEDKKFRILVVDTKRRFENGELKPESLQYSVVKDILGKIDDDFSN